MFLIDDQEDREIYLRLLSEILNQKRILYSSSCFFPWMSEVITHRNKALFLETERLQEVARFFMFRVCSTDEKRYKGSLEYLYRDQEVSMALFSPDLDDKAFILKTFMKSTHSFDKLKNYINIFGDAGQCDPSVEEIDALCPFGFPEWIQLSKLTQFFIKAIVNPLGESISIIDVKDIVSLRMEGKNFKEIAKDLITDHAIYQASQSEEEISTQERDFIQSLQNMKMEEHYQNMALEERQEFIYKNTHIRLLGMLEDFPPSALDDFLT